MYQRKEYPDKSWSFSRYSDFIQCPRMYYYNTFGQWNGWEIRAPERAKQIYRLRKMQNIFILSGQLVHEEIALAIRNGQVNSEAALLRIRKKMNAAVIDSRDNIERWRRTPRDYTILHEYYYGDGVTKQRAGELMRNMEESLNNLPKTSFWQRLESGEAEIVEMEKNNFPYFSLLDYKVYSILDLLYKYEGEYYIVDWKSGQPQPEAHRRQIGIYYLYVLRQYPEIKLKNLHANMEYLSLGESVEINYSASELVELKDFVVKSMLELDSFLIDTEQNIPREEQAFPALPGTHCRFCNFLEVCPHGRENFARQAGIQL